MAGDALSIPFDIPWTRVAWSRDMLDRTRGGSVPSKWRTSMAVYAYPVPLEQTAEDYPDSRIVYLKVSASITGFTKNEALSDETVLNPDDWVQDAWDTVLAPGNTAPYWPCLCAFVQLSIHPRVAAGTEVSDDDYPYVMDFEPKKRELYEAVTDTREMLSGSAARLGTQKGATSTTGTEQTASLQAGISGLGLSLGGSVSERSFSNRESIDMTTTDSSTERRETLGFSTQLSQMYQLFNGYHLGTNRALFAIFARPHTKTAEADQVPNNLLMGERRLEGIQDMFVVVHLPRTMPGMCLDAWIDTGNKPEISDDLDQHDNGTSMVVTRRLITGCADFVGDKLAVMPPPPPPAPGPRVMVVGEGLIVPGERFQKRRPGELARLTKGNHTVVADHLNLLQAEVRRQAMVSQADTGYAPRRYTQTDAFRHSATRALRASTKSLSSLVSLGYLTASEEASLAREGIRVAGDVFKEPAAGAWPEIVLAARARLLDALTNALVPRK